MVFLKDYIKYSYLKIKQSPQTSKHLYIRGHELVQILNMSPISKFLYFPSSHSKYHTPILMGL